VPRISIVTPSFNQAAFLEETIHSVLDQNYPNLEYVIIDGGSTDGSVEIIRQYERHLAFWVSEPDGGQYDAINKGFRHTTGELMGWLNSDDKYLPWTFSTLADLMVCLPQIQWVTSLTHLFWDERGRMVQCESHPGFSRELVLRGGTLPGAGWPAWAFIQQESTFWRRELWQKSGGTLDLTYSLAADYDLWMRFSKTAQLCSVSVPLAGFRRHSDQKTARQMAEYSREARACFLKNGGCPPRGLHGFWLKNWGKLLRHFQRRHAFACAQQGLQNHAAFNSSTGEWEVRDY
jgi:hypothetical protein